MSEAARSQVKALRFALGLTQEQLAQHLGVSFATVNRWEMGRRAPSISSQRRLDVLTAGAAVGSSTSDRRPPAVLVPPTAFTGREPELAEVAVLLEGSRLLTVTGPGGSGKTRLALELIRRSTSPEHQVIVVALDVVADQALVTAAVRAALGLRDIAGLRDTAELRDVALQSDEDQITKHLAALSNPMLLVLDNCEHLMDAVRSLVGAVMRSASCVRILATSRIVLNLPGEQVWFLPPMNLPVPGSGATDVNRSDAGRLFIERAQGRQPGFVLDAGNTAAVVQICRLLDGLPLALELAAAWLSILSAGEIAARLERSPGLLDDGPAGPGRQATLRATVEWSAALLAADDRQLLGRLCIFAGRFTLADAESVVADGGDIVGGLRRLVDSSWVVAAPGEGETTYGLLNTLRTYGLEVLGSDPDATAVRARHAEAFTAFAEASENGLAGPEQAWWRMRMEQATGDVEAALEWAATRSDGDIGLRLVASLWRWWYTSGRIVEGRGWAAVFLSHYRTAAPSVRARALYAAAMLASENGDYVSATSQAMSARREFVAIGDHGGAARSSTVLGNVAKYQGEIAAARRHLTEAVTSQRALGDDWGTAVALQNLASLVIDQAELSDGRELMEESLVLKRRAGDRRSLGYGLINLSDLLLREHLPEQARTALAEAGVIAEALGDDRLAAFVEHNLGDVDTAAGAPADAGFHYRRAVAGFQRVHDRRDVALALCSLGRALLAAGERKEGLTKLRESESLAAEINDELRLSEARGALAAVALPPATGNLPGGLTSRQAEILSLLSAGLSNREIGARLAVSAGTVERHLANVYRKTGVTNRVGATRYALAHGLGAVPSA